jgi:hypothetical protein
MSLTRVALLRDETIRVRLSVALNGFPIFALPKAIARRFARQASKGRVPLSNVIGRRCVVRFFARHRWRLRCKIVPLGSE